MYCIASLLRVGIDSTTNELPRFRQPPQERHRAVLREMLVQVAALRALDARRAAVVAGAAVEELHRVGDPALELGEPALGDADAAGMAVVDEDRRQTRVLVDVR